MSGSVATLIFNNDLHEIGIAKSEDFRIVCSLKTQLKYLIVNAKLVFYSYFHVSIIIQLITFTQ